MEMTIERLREVRNIKREIIKLEETKNGLYYPVKSPSLSSTGNSSEPGDPTARSFWKIQKLEAEIEEYRCLLIDEVSDIMRWLHNDVKQSELRQIIKAHYIEGLSWEDTTREVLGYYGTDSARMRVYRYFGKV